MSRKTQITVPEDIDVLVQFYIESEMATQGRLTWTQALLQMARKGSPLYPYTKPKEETK